MLEPGLPMPGIQSWVVGPGAALMGGWMAWHLDRMRLSLRQRVLWAGVAGCGLGVLNTPVALGLMLVTEIVVPASRTGALSVSHLVGGIWRADALLVGAAFATALGAPIAAPCGAVMGVLIALLCRRVRSTL